jgi:hypothetical protein
MSKKKFPIKRYFPQKAIIKLEEILQSMNENKYEKEYFYYIMDLIYRIPTWDKSLTDSKYIPINRTELSKRIGKNKMLHLNFLVNNSIMVTDNMYIPGEKSKGYKFHPDIEGGMTFDYIHPEHQLWKKIITERNNRWKNFYRYPDYIQKMKAEFFKIEFDYINAEKWIKENIKDETKQNHNLLAIELFRDKRNLYFKRNKTNKRIDTNLTNLKKELRDYIKGDLVIVDLKNSQPLLLAYLLIQIFPIVRYVDNSLCFPDRTNELIKTFGESAIREIKKIPQKHQKDIYEELKIYFNWVVTGVFYEEFSKTINKNITRDDVKDITFEILYSKNSAINNKTGGRFVPYQKGKKIFSQLFPMISDTLVLLKKKNYKALSIYLQKLEAEIFIDKIAKTLVEAGIIPLTIHDSLILNAKEKNRASVIVQTILKEYFLATPKFSINVIGM